MREKWFDVFTSNKLSQLHFTFSSSSFAMKTSQTIFQLSFVFLSFASDPVTFPFEKTQLNGFCTDSSGDRGIFLVENDCNPTRVNDADIVGFLKSVGPVVCCVRQFEPPKKIIAQAKIGSRSKNYCARHGAVKPTQLDFHIVGGTDSDVGEFPHVAALGYENFGEVEFDCGGALISDNFVITAAHCCNRRKPTIVRLGRVSRSFVLLGGSSKIFSFIYR